MAAGVAWRAQRVALEADVRWHTATDAYSLFESDLPGTLCEAAPSAPPVTSAVNFSDPPYEARAVLNAALGGHVVLSPMWMAHFGMFTDESPVADPESSILRKANLLGFTVGSSLQREHLSGSLGLGFTTGTSGNVRIASLSNGEVVETTLRIRSLSLVYALSYAF